MKSSPQLNRLGDFGAGLRDIEDGGCEGVAVYDREHFKTRMDANTTI